MRGLLERLDAGEVLVGDGVWGTQLTARGLGAGSLIFQATIGCPHNRFAFCSMYSDAKFRARPTSEIVEDLDTAALATNRQLAIADATCERFPNLERFTINGSAKFLAKKSCDEWQRIAAAGITRIHTGLESGDAETLDAIRKGITPEGRSTWVCKTPDTRPRGWCRLCAVGDAPAAKKWRPDA